MPFEASRYDLNALSGAIHAANSIIITAHVNPDGDAIGSALGLYHYLKAIDKQVVVVVPNDYPEFLHWMPANDNVLIYTRDYREANKLIEASDLIFCLDFNAIHRVEGMRKILIKSTAVKVLIDHHISPEDDFDIIISETSVSSTAELVFECIETFGDKDKISKEAAECLYVGIMTDTGSFSFNCNHRRTYEITADLVALGVEAEKIHRLVYDTYSENRIRLLGHSLVERMVVIPELCMAYIYLSMEDLEKFEFRVGDTEGLVNYPLSIKGISISALFTEKRDKIRISLRSKGDFSVNEFVRKYFEGGGHRNAAGGNSYKPMKETLEEFEKVLKLYREEFDCKSVNN